MRIRARIRWIYFWNNVKQQPVPPSRHFPSNRFVPLGQRIRLGALFFVALGLFSAGAFAQSPPPIRLANISTRLAVGTGGNVLIGGFIIDGSQPKKVLLRGLGPSLPVNANLADPVLELHQGNDTLATTDNWRDTQQDEVQATIFSPRSDYEAVMIKTLTPGAYTVILSGKGQTTGVALVEVYDLDGTVDSKLANIATRGFVSTGDNVLIGGTIVVGNGTTDVLFRAIGPSLIPFGIGNAVQDTTLELFNGQGSRIATNDDWQDTQKTEIEATKIAPTDPREAAILRSLSPGNYTAIVRGKNNTSGVGLIEAYQVK